MPTWADGKEDAWLALSARWRGEDAEFNALSERNKANRGSGGTHCAGNRNHGRFKAHMVYMYTWNNLYLFPFVILLDTHNIFLSMQETHLERPCSDYEVWEMMKQKKPDMSQPQPSLPEFYGTAKEDGANYLEAFTGFHPEVEDPRAAETDERAVVVAGRGREHGRFKILDRVIPRTPALSLTRIKATLTADDPAIPPRRPSRANDDVSFSHFHHISENHS